jgi:2-polyprenyl-3-methyl-5-hydroxy-6-metoxy-1,4-benzoquinol methylase
MFNINSYLELINCPLCNSNIFSIKKKSQYSNVKNVEELFSIYKSSGDELMLDQLVSCSTCSFEYLNPRIKSEIILKSYAENQDIDHISQDKLRYKTFANSMKKILAKVNMRNTENIKFLDIGSASGIFLKVIKDMGFNEIGFEPSNWMVNFGKKNYNVNIKQGLIQNVESNKYDFISFWDVLEHVTDLQGTLEKVDELTKKDSYLIINVPDIDSYAKKIMKFNWPFYLNVHLYYFRKKTLEKAMNKYNFKLVYNFSHWQYLELEYILNRASKYFNFFSLVKKIANYLGLSKIILPYNMGQTTFIFKKND